MATGPIQNNSAAGAVATQISRSEQTEKTDKANKAESDIAKSDGKSSGVPASGVNISPAAKDRAAASMKARNIALSTPDIREDKVAMLKAQIDSGTYKIDSGKIADGMMREAIKEHLALNE
jgi:negative regulator of flagellin synthesis FlgM